MCSSIPSGSEVQPFVARHISQVRPARPNHRWLIEPLWFAGGVGILGGHAKVCKTLAAEMALAVASGQPALGALTTHRPGTVLFYGAEDALPLLRARFEGLALCRGLALDPLSLYLLDIPVMRLDRDGDLQRLRAAVKKLCPRLLVLDPLVRIARLDENSAADVSALLGSLRALQRDYDLAVMVIHHSRKSPASHPSQALRGSSDIAAWSDTNLYLTRKAQRLTLQVEHRFAAPPEPLSLQLCTKPTLHLKLNNANTSTPPDTAHNTLDPLEQQILNSLSAIRPLSTVAVRALVHRRKEHVVAALKALAQQGYVTRTPQGWRLIPSK